MLAVFVRDSERRKMQDVLTERAAGFPGDGRPIFTPPTPLNQGEGPQDSTITPCTSNNLSTVSKDQSL